MQPLSFTPLEAALISFCSALIVGLIVRHFAGQNTVSCEECRQHREDFEAELEALREERAETAKKDKEDHAMILRMLRSIVCHLPLEPDKKESILNDNGGHK